MRIPPKAAIYGACDQRVSAQNCANLARNGGAISIAGGSGKLNLAINGGLPWHITPTLIAQVKRLSSLACLRSLQSSASSSLQVRNPSRSTTRARQLRQAPNRSLTAAPLRSLFQMQPRQQAAAKTSLAVWPSRRALCGARLTHAQPTSKATRNQRALLPASLLGRLADLSQSDAVCHPFPLFSNIPGGRSPRPQPLNNREAQTC